MLVNSSRLHKQSASSVVVGTYEVSSSSSSDDFEILAPKPFGQSKRGGASRAEHAHACVESRSSVDCAIGLRLYKGSLRGSRFSRVARGVWGVYLGVYFVIV